jgi:hypothetical protein
MSKLLAIKIAAKTEQKKTPFTTASSKHPIFPEFVPYLEVAQPT